MKRTCGPESGPDRASGCAQIHAGQQTLTRLVFEQRGGTEISSLRISPRITASRCSAISSWCQLILTGAGSNCGQAAAKNSIKRPECKFIATVMSKAARATIGLGCCAVRNAGAGMRISSR
jgi:hypothetical protein